MCLVLLGRRQQAKRLADPLRAGQKEAVLRELAFTMMRDRARDMPNDRVSAVIGPVLPRVSSSVGELQFLADIRANGLLFEPQRDVYCFAHHTFQEYLAAARIREHGPLQTLIDNVDDPWWRETTLLYAAGANAGAIIEACLASGRLPALALAFDCADAASELDPELRSRLERLLSDATNPNAPDERRRLAAAVIATQQLRATVQLGDGTQVCAAPVSQDLYQLFTNQMRVSRQRALDDLGQHASGNPSGAVTGIRATDAIAFIDWLNLLLERDVTYRLLGLNE
jgi:hypothetical protein